MTVEFLKAKYSLTILEANVFILFNTGHEVDSQFDKTLIKALKKINS